MTDPIDQTSEGSPTIEPPTTYPESAHGLTEGPGTKIGRYKLLEQIGEGGSA